MGYNSLSRFIFAYRLEFVYVKKRRNNAVEATPPSMHLEHSLVMMMNNSVGCVTE